MSEFKPTTEEKSWRNVLGAWLGIGTAPGALIIGAGIAARHGGQVPVLAIIFSALAMFTILYFQGLHGVLPPDGEGTNLTQLAPNYFSKTMQRILGAAIAVGMIGWFGFNVGLGGAALSALLNAPGFVGPLMIGIPTLALTLMGMRRWNGLAVMTTLAVIILVVMVVVELAARTSPLKLMPDNPLHALADIASYLGYVAVFSVRAPDFTAGLKSKRDLIIADLMLTVPVVLISLAGVGLYMGTGTIDLVSVLTKPGTLMIGNLLVALAVIAPTFTILVSAAPALHAATGLNQRIAMYLITGIGLVLAITRFDLYLLEWLSVIAALLPPIVVPLVYESISRRRGNQNHTVPILSWLPGSVFSAILTMIGQPYAPIVGLLISGIGTYFWRLKLNQINTKEMDRINEAK